MRNSLYGSLPFKKCIYKNRSLKRKIGRKKQKKKNKKHEKTLVKPRMECVLIIISGCLELPGEVTPAIILPHCTSLAAFRVVDAGQIFLFFLVAPFPEWNVNLKRFFSVRLGRKHPAGAEGFRGRESGHNR